LITARISARAPPRTGAPAAAPAGGLTFLRGGGDQRPGDAFEVRGIDLEREEGEVHVDRVGHRAGGRHPQVPSQHADRA
jgi:hypothetical protein